MDLNTAIARLEGMRGLYRAFEDVEEVLRLATGAENLVKERTAEAAKLAAQIEDLKKDLAGLVDKAEAARGQMDAERRARDVEAAEAEKAASQMRTSRAQEFEVNLAKAVELASAAKQRLNDEIRALTADKAALEPVVASLKDELQRLKSRITGA